MFCPKCGNQMQDSDMFCSNCGYQRMRTNNMGCNVNTNQSYNAPVNQVYSEYNSNHLLDSYLIDRLRSKIKTEAIAWIVIASIQAVIALFSILLGEFISGIVILPIAILNFFVSMKDFDYEKKIAIQPVGIVEKYKPIGGYIFMLLFNLFMGGIIGMIGSIFCFVTRNYVIQNEQQFIALENKYLNQESASEVVKNVHTTPNQESAQPVVRTATQQDVEEENQKPVQLTESESDDSVRNKRIITIIGAILAIVILVVGILVVVNLPNDEVNEEKNNTSLNEKYDDEKSLVESGVPLLTFEEYVDSYSKEVSEYVGEDFQINPDTFEKVEDNIYQLDMGQGYLLVTLDEKNIVRAVSFFLVDVGENSDFIPAGVLCIIRAFYPEAPGNKIDEMYDIAFYEGSAIYKDTGIVFENYDSGAQSWIISILE